MVDVGGAGVRDLGQAELDFWIAGDSDLIVLGLVDVSRHLDLDFFAWQDTLRAVPVTECACVPSDGKACAERATIEAIVEKRLHLV